MRCEHVKPELVGYFSGELSPGLSETIQAHLSSCSSCTREAEAVRQVGAAVTRGLKAWVDQGACPPGLAAQIQSALIPEVPARSRFARWLTVSGLASVVAVGFFLLLLGTRPELGDSMIAIPFLGRVADRLNQPDFVEGKVTAHVSDSLFQATGTVRTFHRSVAKNGLTVTVHRVQLTPTRTRVQFSVRGMQNMQQVSTSLFEFLLYGPEGPLMLQGFAGDIRSDTVMINAYFAPISAGFPRELSVWVMPKVRHEQLTWEIGQDRRTPPTGPQASVVSWSHDGRAANLTIMWPVQFAYRIGGWSASDALGNSYPVREGLHGTGSGAIIQQLFIDVPDRVVPVILKATWVEYYERGPWDIPLTN